MVDVIAAALLAASLPGSYDCAIERHVLITEDGVSNDPIRFSGSDGTDWRFALRAAGGADPSVTIDWSEDPIQIAGTYGSRGLAPGQLAVGATRPAPCTFAAETCTTLIALSSRDDGTAAFSIIPAGSVLHGGTGVRSLFHVVFLGTCRRRNGAERS